jgi:low affinity Fe/Cu permease
MTKPARSKKHANRSLFDRLAGAATAAAGSPYGFGFALLTVVVWAALGPVFGYSETWQLVINTSTTIITFLMVFLIQQSQNKDSCALHLKLNELLVSHHMASNSLLNLEDLDEKELHKLRQFYLHLAELSEKAQGIKETHSIDEAKAAHKRKNGTAAKKTA